MDSNLAYWKLREAIEEEVIDEINEYSDSCGGAMLIDHRIWINQAPWIADKKVDLDELVDDLISGITNCDTRKPSIEYIDDIVKARDCMIRSLEKLNKAIAEAE